MVRGLCAVFPNVNRPTVVAFKVGFSDSNYFARQFRSITGVSPAKYRSQAGADDSDR